MERPERTGSRTAGYLVAGGLVTVPGWLLMGAFLGISAAAAVVVVIWATGIVWLLKRQQEDPEWDSRPVVSKEGRRSSESRARRRSRAASGR